MTYSKLFHKRMKALSNKQIFRKDGVVDMHLHLVDFLEETEGLQALILSMDVSDFCQNKGLPINLHQNVTSVGDNSEYKYLHELEHVLKNFSTLPVVWAHCGVSKRVTHKQYTDMLKPLFNRYDKLFVDLSWGCV